MNQTKIESMVEAWTNVFIGFPINYGANLAILPWAWDAENPASSAFWIGVLFTVISVLRTYILRRTFNGKAFSHKVTVWGIRKYRELFPEKVDKDGPSPYNT